MNLWPATWAEAAASWSRISLGLLDLVRAACKGNSESIAQAYRPFNHNTQDGRNMQAYSNLLGQAIRSMIDLREEKDLDSLFTGSRTSALVNTIQGLDDFELIAFLVVQEVREPHTD